VSREIGVLILISVTLLALTLPLGELTFLALVSLAGGLYLFIRGFRLLTRKRLLMNTPTSKIRSAAMGLVEVSGLATGPYTIATPITGTPCFLYRTTAWEKSGESDWKKAAEETLHVPFFLDDNTGHLLIEPMGADLDLHRNFNRDFSDATLSPHDTPRVLSFLARHGIEPSNRIRIEEWSVQPDMPLFVLGTLGDNPGIEVRPPEDAAASFGGTKTKSRPAPVEPAPEVVRLSESLTPAGEMSQQSRIAAALSKAGISSPAAWQAAGVPYRTPQNSPRVHEVSVNRGNLVHRESESSYDLTPPVVLMKGTNNPTFLISWRSQKEVVSSMSWKCGAMIWGGGAFALLGIYLQLGQ
jgi:hypothetical protein